MSSSATSPTYSEGSYGFPSSPKCRKGSNNFLRSKTLACHNYKQGKCRFDDRCFFSHGEDSTLDMSPDLISPKKYSRRVKSDNSIVLSDEQDAASDVTSNYEPFIPPPPPPYEVAIMEEVCSPTRMSPMYYLRYRHDPYNARGICIEPDY